MFFNLITARLFYMGQDHKLQQTLKGHSHMIAALAVDPNSSTFFSGDNGAHICAWKIGDDTSEPLRATWKEHNVWKYTGVASLAVSADGVLYSGSGDRTVKAWSLQVRAQTV
jgi:WD40 repeat protein